MTFSLKLILLLCLTGCFPPCQAAANTIIGADELRATYISCYEFIGPISIFQNGELAIRYSDLDYYETGLSWGLGMEQIARDPVPLWIKQLTKETFYQYTLPPNIQQTLVSEKFDGVYQLGAALDDQATYSDDWRIITNAPSLDFMADVQYTHYTIDEQEQVPAVYHEYVRQKVNTDGLVNVPVIIEELWEFDFDNDGSMEAFIAAHNFLPWSEENSAYNETHQYKADDPQQLPTDGIGYYSYCLFYSETYMPIEFESSFSASNVLLYDRLYSAPDKPYPSQPIYAYNQNGQIGLYELWESEQEHDEFFLPFGHFQPVVCDLNGDGLYDFFIIDDSAFIVVKIYLQNSDGEFNYIGGVMFS